MVHILFKKSSFFSPFRQDINIGLCTPELLESGVAGGGDFGPPSLMMEERVLAKRGLALISLFGCFLGDSGWNA